MTTVLGSELYGMTARLVDMPDDRRNNTLKDAVGHAVALKREDVARTLLAVDLEGTMPLIWAFSKTFREADTPSSYREALAMVMESWPIYDFDSNPWGLLKPTGHNNPYDGFSLTTSDFKPLWVPCTMVGVSDPGYMICTSLHDNEQDNYERRLPIGHWAYVDQGLPKMPGCNGAPNPFD